MLTEMTKLIVAFRNFANAPKNESLFCTCVCITFRCDKYSTVQVHAGYQQVFSNNAALEQKTRTDNLQQQCSVTTNDTPWTIFSNNAAIQQTTRTDNPATMQRYNKRHARTIFRCISAYFRCDRTEMLFNDVVSISDSVE